MHRPMNVKFSYICGKYFYAIAATDPVATSLLSSRLSTQFAVALCSLSV